MAMTMIETVSGRMVDVTRPHGQILLADVVASLERLPRFLGHTSAVWSVWDHSCLVSWLAQWMAEQQGWEPEMVWMAATWGLWHDGHEAYIGDVPGPLKPLASKLVECAAAIDGQILCLIGLGTMDYNQKNAVMALVYEADRMALAMERAALKTGARWPNDPEAGLEQPPWRLCADVDPSDRRRWRLFDVMHEQATMRRQVGRLATKCSWCENGVVVANVAKAEA